MNIPLTPRMISPMASGNGAYVVHQLLETHITGYTVNEYNPYWTLIPFLINRFASTKQASLIHTTPDYAIFSHNKNIPLVISFQNYVLDSWMGNYSSWLQRLHYRTDLRLFTRMAIKKSSAITAVSKFTADLAKKDLGVKKNIEVIYNAVNEEIFTPKHSTKNNNSEIRIFFSGNLTKRKGAQWLPLIAEKLNKNIHIYYTQGLRTRTALPYHDQLHPIGAIPFKNMPTRYNEMDILLMPTVREGLSLAVLEAMACGLPVVASDCSSLSEQIEEGKGGFLCPIGDTERFAEKLNYLAESPAIVKEMGQFNRDKVERIFSLNKMVARYEQLFERILQ